MKFSDFKFVKRSGKSTLEIMLHGTVQVETGILFWKKIQHRPLRKKVLGPWFFGDTGEELTPPAEVELEKAINVWEAQNGVIKTFE